MQAHLATNWGSQTRKPQQQKSKRVELSQTLRHHLVSWFQEQMVQLQAVSLALLVRLECLAKAVHSERAECSAKMLLEQAERAEC
jgi:hypothetical protein